MDKRIKYRVVVDTETCPLDRELNDVVPSNMFTYDIGWAIVDKRGTVYRTRSFIVEDIFFKENELMQSAYYANKIPKYMKDIENGTRIVKPWWDICRTFKTDCKEFNIDEAYAHNMRFDIGTLNNTDRWLSKSRYRYFFPYGMKICDTLKMASDVIGTMPTYQRFCEENGFMTKHKNPKPRMTAEILYKFITKDLDFVESHTGLEDVLIEKEILAYCYRQHKKMRKYLYES